MSYVCDKYFKIMQCFTHFGFASSIKSQSNLLKTYPNLLPETAWALVGIDNKVGYSVYKILGETLRSNRIC